MAAAGVASIVVLMARGFHRGFVGPRVGFIGPRFGFVGPRIVVGPGFCATAAVVGPGMGPLPWSRTLFLLTEADDAAIRGDSE